MPTAHLSLPLPFQLCVSTSSEGRRVELLEYLLSSTETAENTADHENIRVVPFPLPSSLSPTLSLSLSHTYTLKHSFPSQPVLIIFAALPPPLLAPHQTSPGCKANVLHLTIKNILQHCVPRCGSVLTSQRNNPHSYSLRQWNTCKQ